MKYMLNIIIAGLLIGLPNQIRAISFAKTFGGGDGDGAYSIQQTSDGGYIVAGGTSSFGAGGDFLVIKLSSNGDIVWAKTFGGGNSEGAFSIQQTSDGGYIVAGETFSFGAGGGDFLVIKTQDGQMGSDCPWYDCNPIVTSPSISSSSPSITVTSPSLTTTSPTLSITSPTILTFNVCSLLGEVDTIPPNSEIKPMLPIKLESFSFTDDKISLRFSGYFEGEIKIVLFDITESEIISKSLQFTSYIEIKEEKIKKIPNGIYFLKIYSGEKEIANFKMIKK